MRTLYPAMLVALVFLAGCAGESKPYTGPALPYTPEPPKPKEPNPVALISTPNGDITVELFEDDAPNTVANFVELADKGFYNGLTFHRIIQDFMIQGGDPKGDGSGGPGYRFRDETKRNPQKLEKYSLAMANSGPDTNGSQFFIMTTDKPQPQLQEPGTGVVKHTIFGKVTKGQNVVDQIAAAKPPVKIDSIKILTKRNRKYEVQGKIIDAPNPPAPTETPKTPDATKTPDAKNPDASKPPENKEAPKDAPKPAETK